MGFYIRKSLRVGPLRFNLSKSGVGVSAGIKGFRVGSGPRGNYVHMGRHGIYYRQTLLGGSSDRRSSRSPQRRRPKSQPALDTTLGHEPLEEIDSGDVARMRDSSSEALLREFDSKRRRHRLAPVTGFAGILIIGLCLVGQLTPWITVPLIALLAAATVATYIRDQLIKTVVLFYDFDSQSESQFQALHDAMLELRRCSKSWHIEAEGDVIDWKRNAGASSIVRRRAITITTGSPPYVKTNIRVPHLPAGRETLYFFPDRLLVFTRQGVGAVSYSDLRIERDDSRFIEDGTVPRDAKIVDHTWRYVNKKGGPDRRFKDNRQLPIALYENVHLTSETGLNEMFELSRVGAGAGFEHCLTRMRDLTPSARTPRWRVSGIDHDTGLRTALVLEAVNAPEARERALDRGFSRIDTVEPAPARV